MEKYVTVGHLTNTTTYPCYSYGRVPSIILPDFPKGVIQNLASTFVGFYADQSKD